MATSGVPHGRTVGTGFFSYFLLRRFGDRRDFAFRPVLAGIFLFEGGLARRLALLVSVVHGRIAVADDGPLERVNAVLVDLPLEVQTVHERRQIVVRIIQVGGVGVGGVLFGTEAFDVIVSLARPEFQVERAGNLA